MSQRAEDRYHRSQLKRLGAESNDYGASSLLGGGRGFVSCGRLAPPNNADSLAVMIAVYERFCDALEMNRRLNDGVVTAGLSRPVGGQER